MSIRRATLDDAGAISALCRGAISRWQRMSAGQVEDVAYEDLSLYERWLHGGAWMSIETASIWLSHLLSGAGEPCVLEENGEIVAYLEAFYGNEPAPFGQHLHIGSISGNSHASHTKELISHFQQNHPGTLTIGCSAYEPGMHTFLESLNFEHIETVIRVDIPAQTGQAFYKANVHEVPDYDQVKGWLMPFGRTGSARMQWETVWANLWKAIPEIIAQKTHRLYMSVAGQDAYIVYQQQLYDPRTADVYCWTSKPLSKQLLSAIRDRAHREGFRNLAMIVTQAAVPLLNVTPDSAPYKQEIFIYKP